MNHVLLLLLKCCLAICVCVGLILVYLNANLSKQFESLSWAVGAKIYARPIELFQGAPFTKDQILYELETLNYTEVSSNPVTGQFVDLGKSLIISSRGHKFPDGAEKAKQITIEFGLRSINAIFYDKMKVNEVLRLEPAVLAQLSGPHADRDLINLSDLPKHFTDLLLVLEDRQFFDHKGISLPGILRAAINNILVGRFAQGGSTLTQQLVKNLYLTRERTLTRKVLEAIYAILLEASFEKERILQAYINEVFLGQWGNRAIHGFGTASHFYFGRPIAELDIAEQALLVGLIKGPSIYNPRRSPKRAIERRNLVLSVAKNQGVISESDWQSAVMQSLNIPSRPADRLGRFPGYVNLVKRELTHDYSPKELTTEGLRVYTAFDPQAHRGLVEGRRNALKFIVNSKLDPDNDVQIAALMVDIPTGEIQAVLASRDDSQGFHRVLDARRQIGSLIKPFVVAAALEKNNDLHAGTLVRDQAISMRDSKGTVWTPQNYDKTEAGIVRLESLISMSINQATVHLAVGLGLDSILDSLVNYNIAVGKTRPPATVLGASEMSPFAIAGRYQGLLNQGYVIPLKAVRSVVSWKNGQLNRKPFQTESILAPPHAVMVDHMMRRGAQIGTGKVFGKSFNEVMASKTGTTDNGRDAWFIGADGRRMGLAWVGFDDNRKGNLVGALAALPVIQGGFRYIDRMDRTDRLPSGLKYGWVDHFGQVVGKSCEGAIRRPLPQQLVIAAGTACNIHQKNKGKGSWLKEWFGE